VQRYCKERWFAAINLNFSFIFCTNNFAENSWDFRFSWRRVRRWLSAGLLRRVIWQKFTDVSWVSATSVFRELAHHLQNGSSKHLWNIGELIPEYNG
jgi:hypothetical protein